MVLFTYNYVLENANKTAVSAWILDIVLMPRTLIASLAIMDVTYMCKGPQLRF